MNTTWIRVAYGVVLALVVLFTVQFGVAMALPGPKPPEDPGITFRQLAGDSGDSGNSGQNRLTASIDSYYSDSKNYRDDYVEWQRNGFLAITGLAALVALIALILPAAVNYLRWGLLLGAAASLLVALYIATKGVPQPAPAAQSILALVAAGEPRPLDFAGRFLRFALSFVALILLVFIGLWRLTEWPSSTRRAAVTTTTHTPAAATATPAPAPSAWAPAPAPPAAGESTTEVGESPSRWEPSPPVAGTWQRPADGEPARAPDTTP